jgi:hypothetical protein
VGTREVDASRKTVSIGPESKPARSFRRVVRVASGNFLEMYDFQVFGYYATAIARTFFPSTSEFTSLILYLSTF